MADTQAVWNPVEAIRERYPSLANESDLAIRAQLADPKKFRSAFPEYASMSDSDIQQGLTKFSRANPITPIAGTKIAGRNSAGQPIFAPEGSSIASEAKKTLLDPHNWSQALSGAEDEVKGAVKGVASLLAPPNPETYTLGNDPLVKAVKGELKSRGTLSKQAADFFKKHEPVRGAVSTALASIPIPGVAAMGAGVNEGEAEGKGAEATGRGLADAAMLGGGEVVGRVIPPALRKGAEAIKSKYAPEAVDIDGEKVPVSKAEAHPDTPLGRKVASIKRSGSGASKFENLEKEQQQAVRNVVRKTAQKTSGQIGPVQQEPGAAVNDAATAVYAQAAPIYDALDKSLVSVPEGLRDASKVVQDAMAKAKKLGIDLGDEGTDISKIRPDKDGAIQWGGSKISRTSNPDRWQALVKDGIIDDSGHGTPLKAYRMVRSQLLKMQRGSSDAAARFAIGQEVKTMTDNMDSALKGTELQSQWKEADRLWSKGKALQEVSEAITDATKGTPATAQAPGISRVSTKLQGSNLVDKLNTLYDDGTLERAFNPDEVRNLRASADILDRMQRNPVGKGSGESMSISRGLTHAVRGFKGPMIGAVGGLLVGGFRGAEMGAGLGFIVQSIGERALIGVMTSVDGVKALDAVEKAKTAEQFGKAMQTISFLSAAGVGQHDSLKQ